MNFLPRKPSSRSENAARKMAIHALPHKAVRALGASQVLNDPAAAIKELVDNALDARATSIAIEISSNTVDSIQVRDNGHGIPPEDRQLVARPHCTSKITGEDDLVAVGGTSLGFRGEALASVAEMSGSLTINTRTEGEYVATALKISHEGEVVGQQPSSMSVGTIVKVADFMTAHPVRRQVALKNTEKCLKKVKQLIQSYAFARPQVRLSLRVLKAKNDKANWTYAPKPGGNAEDAAFKIAGSACATQCVWSVIEERGWCLKAFLPSTNADASKISNIGSFLSVDARPVSAVRGTLKLIIKLFREALKKANSQFDDLKEPFIYLDIACPPASYDVNIEPGKDDVLFECVDTVMGLARRLFDAVYPVQEAVVPTEVIVNTSPSKTHQHEIDLDEDVFVTSFEAPLTNTADSRLAELPRSEPAHKQSSFGLLDSFIDEQDQSEMSNRRSAFRSNMYGCDEEDLDFLNIRPPSARTEADFEELRLAKKDVHVSNPWVMAKMNTSARRPVTLQHEVDSQLPESVHPQHSSIALLGHDQLLVNLDGHNLPTPQPTSSLPRQDFQSPNQLPDVRLARDARLIGSQSLPLPQTPMSPPSTLHADIDNHLAQRPPDRHPLPYDYTLYSQPTQPPAGTPLHAILDVSARPRRTQRGQPQQIRIDKPFVSPLKDQPRLEKVWLDHLTPENQKIPRAPRKRPYQTRANNALVVQGELGDLVEDPRPLTPPRGNRDIREFATSVDLTAEGSAASLIESRNYTRQKRACPPGNPDRGVNELDNENIAPAADTLSGRGFVPVSELVAMEARIGPFNANVPHPKKRRKTSEASALRELSQNTACGINNEDDDERRTAARSRAISRRRRTTNSDKFRRTKSSLLPLERVPEGQGTHRLISKLWTTVQNLRRLTGTIEQECSLLNWKMPAIYLHDSFSALTGTEDIRHLTSELRNVLSIRFHDGEMVQDLGLLLQNAFATLDRG